MLPNLTDIHLGEIIHESARCRVHRGRRSDGTPVIVKELRPERPEPAQIAWFRREYEVQHGLDLACVVKAYALERHEWTWLIVLEDFGGTSLDRLFSMGAHAPGRGGHEAPPRSVAGRSIGERLQIALSAAAALGNLHAKNVIHKDITPGNLVWNPETGTLKIIDLGLSTVLPRETPGIRSPGALEGTLRYLSPEQTGRVNRAVDYRSDFYSLGATLYELFTGAPPFTSDDPMELVHAHIARRPPSAHERSAAVPRAVSDVIDKLLAKTPEARYQSSYGLVWDLEQCAARAKAGADEGRPFELASHDVAERFRIPGDLYGRDREQRALLSAFEGIASAVEGRKDALALVTGYAGIGKSSLVRELYEPITKWRGYFVSGKFEQLNRSRPYSAFLHAFGSLVRQLLGESEQTLADVRKQLLAALGASGRVVTDLLPELELIVGPQPPIAVLGPTEAQNRFNAVFGSFIRVFAPPSRPLVLFLDDLQWADSGSLKLLELLFQDEEPHCLFVIGAYRDHEVAPGDPLLMTLGTLEKAGIPIERIPLAPLGLPEVTRLVADTVGLSGSKGGDEVRELAAMVAQKTEGNPLFVTELLKSLYDEGLLDFDRAAGRWRWDVAQIAARGVSASVVDLLVGKLRRLPEESRRAVETAACIGGSFDLDTLAVTLETTAPEAFRRLMPAVKEGFVTPTSGLVVADATLADSAFVIRDFKFVHDRIQQAAYNLVPEAERDGMHLRIGRLLLARGVSGRDEGLFQVADQLNRGVRLMEGKERRSLAELDLDAGLRAHRSLAYEAAGSYLEAGIACLSEASWEEDYELCFALHKELSAAEFSKGDYERSEALAKEALSRARSPADKVELYITIVLDHTMRGRYREALREARDALAPFGVDLPLDLSDDELVKSMPDEFAKVDRALGGRAIASLRDEPEMTDPAARSVTALMLRILPPSYLSSTALYGVVVCRVIAVMLEKGPSPLSVDLFSNYGHIMNGVRGDYEAAYAFGKLAVDLSDRFNRPDCKCRSAFHLASWISGMCRPLREIEEMSEMGFRAGLEGGERIYSGFTLCWWPVTKFHEGLPIDEVKKSLVECLHFNQKSKNTIGTDILLGMDVIAENFRGATASAADFRGEAPFLAASRANKSAMAIVNYWLMKEELQYVHGDFKGSLASHREAEAVLSAVLGWYGVAYHVLYGALSLAALHGRAAVGEQARTREVLAAAVARYDTLAVACPQNYGHLRALLLGEVARIDRKTAEAADLFEQAMAGARREGFTQHVALAAELSARLWLEKGHERIAASYLQEALHAYKIRGMVRKVELLEERHPALFRKEVVRSHRRGIEDSIETSVSTSASTSTGLLDLASVLKASQALSSEIVLDRLLTKLLQIVVENGGARSGALVLERGGELTVAVDARVDDAAGGAAIVGALQSIPITRYEDASEEIIRYVARTRETVILSDATQAAGAEGGMSFAKTPYVERRRPKSVLCSAFVSQGRLLAVLYMENNLTTGAFTPERTEVLRMLSSQIAISIENAFLYHEIEERVRQRTVELSQRNGELSEAILHLRTTQGQLVQSEKMASLGRLTTGIAHEIKNPLNFVNNFAALEVDLCDELSQALADDPDAKLAEFTDVLGDLRQNADKIRQHGRRADQIVQTMVKHGGGLPGQRAAVDLNALVGDFVRVAHAGAQAKNAQVKDAREIQLENDLDAAAGTVTLVPEDLGRVIVNLFDNAVDAVAARGRAEGPAYAPTIRAGTRREGGKVKIRIQDNGGGVPERIKDRVFEPFFTTKPTGSGTGLGLSLSYDIVVNGHGGDLAFESVEGVGTTFVITLPAPEQATLAHDGDDAV